MADINIYGTLKNVTGEPIVRSEQVAGVGEISQSVINEKLMAGNRYENGNWVSYKSDKNDLEVGELGDDEVLTISNKKDAYVYKVQSNTTTDLDVTIDGEMEEGKLKEVILIIDNSDNSNTLQIAMPTEGATFIYNIDEMYVNAGLSSEFSFLIDTRGETPIIRVAGLIQE